MLVAATGCGSSSSSSSSSGPTSSGGSVDKTPVTITLWHMFAGEESKPFNDALAGFKKKYPWITIKQEVQPNPDTDTFDPNLINAINGGNSPDVAMPFGPDYVGQYCSSGLWQDLTPFMQASNVSISSFAPAAITYTNYGGKQCALPSLTDAYGLYYNKKMFADAGIASPPKTMDELMADAKKLTVKNPDGSIKVAGLRPARAVRRSSVRPISSRAWGAKWFDSDNKAQIAHRSRLDERVQLAEAADRLVRLRQHREVRERHTPNSEFNPSNMFENGKIAMMFDGEWRTAFIGRDVPGLRLRHGARSPRPTPACTAPGRVGGTVVGIPKGAQHPRAGVAAGEVPVQRHQLPGDDGKRPRKRADHHGLGELAGPETAAPVHDVREGVGQSRSRRSRRRCSPAGVGTTTLMTDVRVEVGVRQDPRIGPPRRAGEARPGHR